MKPEDRENFKKLPEGPVNVWQMDQNLQSQMRMRLAPETWAWAEETLDRMGEMCGGDVYERARVVDKENHKLRKWDRWGRDVSEVIHHPAYEANVADVYGFGIVGWSYKKENRESGRRAPMELIFGWGYMGGGADIGLYCPICMTHGATYLLEHFGSREQVEKFVPKLTSCDPKELWTAAMLLTEITGGSDVGSARTVARREGDKWLLTGEKWFSSNVGADLFMVLARPEGAPPGPKGLALFALPRHKADGSQNNFEVRRIKDKVGTRNVPTAEMLFTDAEAELVGAAERGIYYMMEMVNLSRLYNAIGAVGLMARSWIESKRYLEQRDAFGKTIIDHPPVRERLVDMMVELEANTALTFEAVAAFERCESKSGDLKKSKSLLRVLTPMCKYVTGEKVCDFTREMACFYGGNGTIEDFGVERLYRDSLILPIWEGTANIQVIDIFRAIRKDAAHETLFEAMNEKLGALQSPLAEEIAACLRKAQKELVATFQHLAGQTPEMISLHSRKMTDRLIAWCQAVCLTAEADWESRNLKTWRKFLSAARHMSRTLPSVQKDPILTNDRFALDHYEAVANFEAVSEDTAAATVRAVIAEMAAV